VENIGVPNEHARCRSRTAHGWTNRHDVRKGTMGRIKACPDEVIALRLGDKRLQFGGGESIDQASFRSQECGVVPDSKDPLIPTIVSRCVAVF